MFSVFFRNVFIYWTLPICSLLSFFSVPQLFLLLTKKLLPFLIVCFFPGSRPLSVRSVMGGSMTRSKHHIAFVLNFDIRWTIQRTICIFYVSSKRSEIWFYLECLPFRQPVYLIGKVVGSRTPTSTPGSLQRSRSDVDVNAAASAKSRMPAVPSLPSPSPFSSAAALPPGSYASLGKIRNFKCTAISLAHLDIISLLSTLIREF